ncbi:hypothetical protein AX17_004100 [Amanita inopinata Kibby_2008]|nr:hypothetical protein AX17_004100 [Amanita inopinata Kibby_2008]
MQLPTLQNVRIRSTRDALQVFYAVAMSRLPLITRRLDAEERRAIIAGNVYVWEERGANTEPTGIGMERWTDGMGWGPSRVRDEFLFYHQKESDAAEELINPVTPWAQMMRKREAPSTRSLNQPYSSSDQQQSSEPERLIKQTYSVHVYLPIDRAQGLVRKWHLTAYFSQQKLAGLDTIDNIQGGGVITVPEGWFRSARTMKSRRDSRNYGHASQLPERNLYPAAPSFHEAPPHILDLHGYEVLHPLRHCSPSSSSGGRNSPSASPTAQTRPPTSRLGSSQQLVPLEYLQTVSAPPRDPVDEQLLRRFSSS